MSKLPLCNWPAPVEISRTDITRGMVNLSKMPPDEKAKAFARLKETEPEITDFVTRMAGTFGKSQLLIDQATANRLKVGRDDNPDALNLSGSRK